VPLPIVPIIPKSSSRLSSSPAPKASDEADAAQADEPATDGITNNEGEIITDDTKSPSPAGVGPPKSWANLFKGSGSATAAANGASPESTISAPTAGFAKTNNESLASALHEFSATVRDGKLAFIEPRGLVNTGNMCYMNSVSLSSIIIVYL
jgi:ubiquitin carboxyl-terminal hydrolase 10